MLPDALDQERWWDHQAAEALFSIWICAVGADEPFSKPVSPEEVPRVELVVQAEVRRREGHQEEGAYESHECKQRIKQKCR